jgi:hypothetical protein
MPRVSARAIMPTMNKERQAERERKEALAILKKMSNDLKANQPGEAKCVLTDNCKHTK